ncbi:hypothetical protein RGAI101_4058 [Roseobacter sp. GAI101]|nr:hypothetical protein RGAI101_4058 [Roseobacter sp. GAI101]
MQQGITINSNRYRFNSPKAPKLLFHFQSRSPHPKTQQIA